MSAVHTKAEPALQIETVALLASSSVLKLPFETLVQPFAMRAFSWAMVGPAAGWTPVVVAAIAAGTVIDATTRPATRMAILSFRRTGVPPRGDRMVIVRTVAYQFAQSIGLDARRQQCLPPIEELLSGSLPICARCGA